MLLIIFSGASFGLQRAQPLYLEDVEEHLFKVSSIGKYSVDNNRDYHFYLRLLRDLRIIQNYSQSFYDLNYELQKSRISVPYLTNLLKELLDALTRVHGEVQLLQKNRHAEMLKALQIETLNKICTLFFQNDITRSLIKDLRRTQSLDSFFKVISKTYDKNYYKKRYHYLKQNAFPINESEHNAIELSWRQTRLYELIKQGRSWKKTLKRRLFWKNFGDNFSGGIKQITKGASTVFGAIAGNISWGEGALKDNQIILKKLKETLVPFDLVLEKKSYKLTDITIPGHWGHIAIYLGTKEQLQKRGLWDLREMEPFREAIMNGNHIFQVRRWGVEFDSLSNFTNLDEIAVLRAKNFINKEERYISLTLKFLSKQIDRPYDYNFDAMTGERITCTEIIAFSYGSIRWPTRRILGRVTITPNDIGKLTFYKNSPLDFIFYAKKGGDSIQYPTEENFAKTFNFFWLQETYKEQIEKCKRERYRHRNGGLRFHYSCNFLYSTRVY